MPIWIFFWRKHNAHRRITPISAKRLPENMTPSHRILNHISMRMRECVVCLNKRTHTQKAIARNAQYVLYCQRVPATLHSNCICHRSVSQKIPYFCPIPIIPESTPIRNIPMRIFLISYFKRWKRKLMIPIERSVMNQKDRSILHKTEVISE